MTNYPAGSMRGSGIYTQVVVMNLLCETVDDCGFYGDVDVTVDDGGLGYWTCPDCGTEHEIEMGDLEPDPDEAYDRMRDERDGY